MLLKFFEFIISPSSFLRTVHHTLLFFLIHICIYSHRFFLILSTLSLTLHTLSALSLLKRLSRYYSSSLHNWCDSWWSHYSKRQIIIYLNFIIISCLLHKSFNITKLILIYYLMLCQIDMIHRLGQIYESPTIQTYILWSL